MQVDHEPSSLASEWANRLDRIAAVVLVGAVTVVPAFFLPWRSDVFVDPKSGLTRSLTLAAGIAAVGSMILGRRHVRVLVTDVAVAAFTLLVAASAITSVDLPTSLWGEPLQRAGLVSTVMVVLGYAIARMTIRTPERLWLLVVGVVLGASLVAAYGLVQWVGADPWWDDVPGGRVFSSLGQPNWLGAYLVVTLPITIAVAVTARRTPTKWLVIVSAAGQGIVLVTTSSRASWLGAAAALGVTGLLLLVRRRSAGTALPRRVIVGTVLAVVAITGVLLLAWNSSPVARGRSAFDLDAFDVRQRRALWDVAGAIIADHPLLGTGPDTYAIVFPEYRDQVVEPFYAEYLSRFRPESPHNVYLATAAGSGVAASVALIVALVATLARLAVGYVRDQPEPLLLAATAAISGHVVTDAFMTIDVSTSWLVWVVIGGTLTYATADRRDASDASAPA